MDPLIFIPGTFGILLSVLYGLTIHSAMKGWKHLPETGPDKPLIIPSFSIIIAFRNEANHLDHLIGDLKRQNYPNQAFEIWFVDDHSTDHGPRIIEEAIRDQTHMHLITNKGTGKKQAIRTGLAKSRFDTIITTDADVRLSDQWISSYAIPCSDGNFRLVIGAVLPRSSRSVFESIQSLEWMSLIGMSAGTAQRGHAVMCNGANMAFSRQLFLDQDDPLFEKSPSGDDIFLLQAQKRRNATAIGFLKSRKGCVYTSLEPGWSDFLNQRIRWASKSRYYHDRDAIILAGLVWGTNFFLLLLLVLSFLAPLAAVFFAGMWVFKSVPDFLLLRSVTRYYQVSGLLRFFLPVSLVYPIYANLIAFLSIIRPRFTWKDRPYKMK